MFRGHYIILSFFSILIVIAHGHAAFAESAWLTADPPYITDHGDAKTPRYANTPCVPDITFTIRPTDLLHAQLKQSHNVCAIRTEYGLQNAGDNEIMPEGSTISGRVATHAGVDLSLITIPNSPDIMYQSGGLDGTYRYLIRNIKDSVDPAVLSDGTRQLKLHAGITAEPITDPSGALLAFSNSRFSDNGKWMIADVPNVGMTRVNIETKQTLIFGPPLSYSIGANPYFVMAISSDGRYAAISDKSHDIFRMYDLSTCVLDSAPRKTADCRWRDLLPTARSIIPNFTAVLSMGFSTDTTLRFMAGQRLYTVTAAGQSESLIDYLATGDSFASGEGARSYKPYTDVRDPFNKCHLSLISYPYLLTSKINVNRTESVACSGARIKDFYEPQTQTAVNNNEAYQDFLTGSRPQNSFIERAKPTIITTSIAGNDIGFGKIIASCVSIGTCYDTDQQRADLAATIESKFNDLVFLYNQISRSAATGARVYVIGYPELVDPTGNCANNVHLDTQELAFANQLVHFFNTVIKRAADAAEARYIDVTTAFIGHRLCETKSSEVAVNGLTTGDDKTFTLPIYKTNYEANFFFTGQESYHPNQRGHQMLADVIARYINGENVPQDTHTKLLPINPSIEPHRIIDDSRSNPIVTLKGQPTTLTTSGFAAQTSVAASYDKVVLPAGSSDMHGSYSIGTESLPPGFYTISFVGKDSMGEVVQAQKLVYVLTSLAELNNASLLVTPSNQDVDSDGIDDAFDGHIGDPPIHVIPLVIRHEGTLEVLTISVNRNLKIDGTGQSARILNTGSESVLGEQLSIARPVNDTQEVPMQNINTNIKRTLYPIILIPLTTVTTAVVIIWWRKRE